MSLHFKHKNGSNIFAALRILILGAFVSALVSQSSPVSGDALPKPAAQSLESSRYVEAAFLTAATKRAQDSNFRSFLAVDTAAGIAARLSCALQSGDHGITDHSIFVALAVIRSPPGSLASDRL